MRSIAAATITALLLAACSSSAGDDPVATSPAAASSPAPVEATRIEGFTIGQPAWKADGSNWRLTLSWDPPQAFEVDHYRVERDGVTVDDDVTGASYEDLDVEPGSRYSYEVSGVGLDGRTTLPAVERVRTGEPRLADARLEGTFAVRMVVRRASGTENPVRGGAISFTFDPSCGEGACPVRWSMRQTGAEGKLRRDGAVYGGDLRTPLFIRNCFGKVVDEAVDVRLRVTSAAALQRGWRATKLEGTIDEVSSFSGCVTAAIEWSVRGALQI